MDVALPLIPGLILIAVLLGLNAMFVATEFAYVTVRRTQLQHLASEGNSRARRLLTALENLDFYVAASQLGITMATIALGFLGEPVLAAVIEPPVEDLVGPIAPALAHTIAIAVAFTTITALHIILGEFAPKAIALQKPDGTALWLTFPMEVFVRIFRPLIWLLNATGIGLLRLIGVDVRPVSDDPLRVDDIAFTLETSASAGLISRREFDLTRNILRLSTIMAPDLMVPRNNITVIPVDASVDEVRRTFAQHRFTRYPVYQDTIDNIVGIIDVKSAIFGLSHDDDWRQDIEPPVVLPESVKVERALSVAERAGAPMILLVDEFGGTAGMLSVYDVVQFLAGGLPDEYQVRTTDIQPEADGSFAVSGLLPLVEFEDEFGIDAPDVEAHTVGGMVAEILQRVPEEGDEISLNGHQLCVTRMDHHRVDEVAVTLIEGRENEESDEQ